MTPQGQWVLSRVRETLPPRLQLYWRFGLAFMFALGALLVVTLEPGRLADYARIFGLAQAAYIVIIAARIAQVNLALRQELERMAGNKEVAKMLPTHIVFLAAGTILSVALISAVLIERYGGGASLGGAFPYLANLVFFVKVLGLNLVWRFVLIRRREAGNG